ncbi:MAG: phosphotransferase [Proteobacteria bacterium]|nr:phosphotransferase [Pseudomonadota bacterium]
MTTLPEALRDHLATLYPDHHIAKLAALGADVAVDATTKAAGYGTSVRISLVAETLPPIELVCRVASANEFGHDRSSDRAAAALLAFRDFAAIPAHVAAIDVGAIRQDGALVSLRDCGEHYLIATYAAGTLYADDLRRIARTGITEELDHQRVHTLASYLAALHTPIGGEAGVIGGEAGVIGGEAGVIGGEAGVIGGEAGVIADGLRYRRAIRDLVGDGEGIFGIVDGYPHDVPGASAARLRDIERRCVEWRWLLREHEGRACRTHGDFHPFNLLFEGDRLVTLDASRGTCGDPADDVTALAINYLAFALDQPHGWRGLGPLWHRLWATYAAARHDPSLQSVAPPFFAWRALVVCNPRFYPNLGVASRSALLGLVEGALDARHLDPAWADELFG